MGHLNTEFTNQQTNTKPMLKITVSLFIAVSSFALVACEDEWDPMAGTPTPTADESYEICRDNLLRSYQDAAFDQGKNVNYEAYMEAVTQECEPLLQSFDPGPVGGPKLPTNTGTGTRKVA